MKYGFGIDLGGTTVKIAYFDDGRSPLSLPMAANRSCRISPPPSGVIWMPIRSPIPASWVWASVFPALFPARVW